MGFQCVWWRILTVTEYAHTLTDKTGRHSRGLVRHNRGPGRERAARTIATLRLASQTKPVTYAYR